MSMPRFPRPIPPLKVREDIPFLLEAERHRRGAELGVLNGDFALHTLERWPHCSEYVLVDLWQKQDNYLDINVARRISTESNFLHLLRT